MINRVEQEEGKLNIALQRHKVSEYIQSNLLGKQLHNVMNKNSKYGLIFIFIFYIYIFNFMPYFVYPPNRLFSVGPLSIFRKY